MSPFILHPFTQDAEKVRRLRSRIVQTLNVPQRVRLGPSLAAALLDELFEHLVRVALLSQMCTVEVLLC
jgi:hypothetical protein